MGIGSLTKLGISKGMSLGRELFGFLLRSDLNVAKMAEWAGITMDTLKDAPPEALSAILERAARSGAIDPREANNINIQLAKEAQEAYKDSFNIDAIHGQYDVGNSRGFQTYSPDTEKGGFVETPGEALNAFEGTDQKEDNFWTSDLGSWFADRSTGGNDVANYFAGADKTSADLARDNPEFGGAVYPVKLQMKNPFVFETHDELEQAMAEFSDMVGDEYWKKELARVEGKTNRFGEPMKPDPFGGPSAGTQGYVQYLRDMGYDGIKILDSTTDTGNSRTDYVTFTPQQVRSIWANFDPAKKNSPNISAGVAGGAVGLGALQIEGDQ
jgi:hypothetical protein